MVTRRRSPESQYVTAEETEVEAKYALAQRLLVLLSVGGFLLGALFGILGVILVYLGATGKSDIQLFGQNISTGSVGVASIFIAAATFGLVVTRVLAAFNELTKRKT